ncbi:MAG: two-component regulator propeller domain-containing protein [Bacteroidales bacterium]
MKKPVLIWLCLICTCLQFVYGQNPEIRFHNIGIRDGLSHSLVTSVAEDSLGFLWFGTQDGLNRYDGYEFKTYFKGSGNRHPSDSWVSNLYMDSHNQLWIWYQGIGLERFDPFREKFYTYKPDSLDPGSISSNTYPSGHVLRYSVFFEDPDGTLWIGTDNGLNRYNRDNDIFEIVRHNPGDPSSLSDDRIISITGDQEDHIWIGTYHGINRLDRSTGKIDRLDCSSSGGILNDSIISCIYVDPDLNVWAGTVFGGLNIIENAFSDSMRVTRLIDEPLNPNYEPTIYIIYRTTAGEMLVGSIHGLYRIIKVNGRYREELIPETRNIRISHILEDLHGYIWAGSDAKVKNSLFRLHPDLRTVETFRMDLKSPYAFKGKKVQFLHQNKTGLLWIGSEKDGMYRVDLNAKQFKSIDNYPERGLYISDDEVYSIYETGNRELYIGTKTELNMINLNDGSWKGFGNEYNLKKDITYEYSRQLPANLIGVIKETPDGKLWMGPFDYKVSLYDPERELFLNFHQNENDPESFRAWSLRSICITRSGKVYFGGTEEGLCRLKEDGHSFEYFPVVGTGNCSGTNDEHIQYIYEDSDSILWLGTLKGGLNRFDPRSGRFSHFVHDLSDSASISNNRVKCILEPEIYGENILWIGTNNGGLNKFDKEDQTFTSFTMEHGMPSNTIHGILEDKVGNLWLSTNRGLVQFDPVTEEINIYTSEDGLVGNEFNEGAFFKNREGVMYFGGTNGINYFRPGEIQDNPYYDAPVVVTSFKLSGNPVLPGDTIHGRVVLGKSISYTDEIRLTHKDRFLSFGFASLDFAAPKKLKYRYMLEGFEESWNMVDAGQRIISYTNIPSGIYTLKILGTNSDGVWSRTPASITIHMMPPFWKTFWFKLVIVAFILLIFLTILRVRTQLLKNQKLMLEKEVEERTHDLKEANRLLEDQKNEIQLMAERLHESDQMKLKFFTNISHEFRTPLTLIMGPTEKLLQYDHYSDTPKIKRELELIYRNERLLFKLINQLLEIRRVETGNLKLTVARDDLIGYLKSIYELFLPYAEKKQVDFQFRPELPELMIYFDADKVEKILYNLLSNAFKHTPVRGRVLYAVNRDVKEGKEMVRITVTDSGPGIPREHLPHIFERFFQITSKHRSGKISSGIGLSLSRDLVEKHYGTIEVESDGKSGTTFRVYLPLSPATYQPEEILEESEGEYSMEYINSMIETYDYYLNDGRDEPLVGLDLFRILVVEDNLDMQKYLYNELSKSYNVLLAQNGEEGLDISKQNLPDLVLSDIMMPGMDGLEFCKRLKSDELTSHIPVVLLTAKTASETQISGFELGADDYITKPFNAEVLKLKIRNILNHRKQLAEKFFRASNYIPENIKINQIDQGFLEKFVKLVEDNIDDTELSGDMIACELGMSKGNLYKKLKTLTGMTVNIFVRSIRLKVAARLLEQGHYNISEVAYAVGFNNPKYFSTCFSEMFSMAPKEYMK